MRWLMKGDSSIFARNWLRRVVAMLACATLLYFAFGGSLLHQHAGPENACHICQSLHMPALVAASPHLVATPELIARYASLPRHVAPSDSFSLHRASRAPPSA